MTTIRFTIEAEAQHVSGKFINGDDLAAEIMGAIEDSPGSVYVDESEYDVTEWSVDYEVGKPQPVKPPKPTSAGIASSGRTDLSALASGAVSPRKETAALDSVWLIINDPSVKSSPTPEHIALLRAAVKRGLGLQAVDDAVLR